MSLDLFRRYIDIIKESQVEVTDSVGIKVGDIIGVRRHNAKMIPTKVEVLSIDGDTYTVKTLKDYSKFGMSNRPFQVSAEQWDIVPSRDSVVSGSSKEQTLDEYTYGNDSVLSGQDPDFDRLLLSRDARRMGMSVDDYIHYLKKKQQDQEYELNIGSEQRAELKAKADELAEIKRQQLRQERLEDEELAYSRAKDEAEREAEMEKIKRKYEHELKVINTEHSNNMEAIRTGNAHEINKMEKEHRQEKDMFDKQAGEADKDRAERERERQQAERERDKDRQQQRPQPQKPAQRPQKPARPPDLDEPEPEEYDDEEPAAQQLQPTMYHTSQQIGYKPKPQSKPDSDVIDVVAKPVSSKPPALGYDKKDDDEIKRIAEMAGVSLNKKQTASVAQPEELATPKIDESIVAATRAMWTEYKGKYGI